MTSCFDALLLGGVQSLAVAVTVAGDRLDEAPESFRLVLSGSAEIVDGEGVATIADDDPPPSIGVADAAAATEGATASFTVLLSVPSGRSVSVSSATADGAAIAGEDYVAHSGAVVIPAGATSAAVGVGLLDDAVVEAEESFELRIASAQFATLGRAAATATIVDDDAPPPPPPPPPPPAAAPAEVGPPAEPAVDGSAETGAPAADAPAATDPAVTAPPAARSLQPAPATPLDHARDGLLPARDDPLQRPGDDLQPPQPALEAQGPAP